MREEAASSAEQRLMVETIYDKMMMGPESITISFDAGLTIALFKADK